MKRLLLTVLILVWAGGIAKAQQASPDELKKGVNFLETETHSEEANQKLLRMYEGLRVADVTDGMDMVGLPNVGLVDESIHPEWEDTEDMSHTFRGIALTVRYVPTQKSPVPPDTMTFPEWEGWFYSQHSAEPFADIIQDGHAIMIDDAEHRDIGSIGSYNILDWYRKGARGVVTDAASRDTDEIAKQGVPLYLKKRGRGIRPGRNELESVNKPIVIGGVTVKPGDVVVADGDGVIVVPRRVAKEVAQYAREVMEGDMEARRSLYEDMGWELDETVKKD